MSWEEHQLRLTRNVRLLLSSPESVFRELKEISKEIRSRELLSGPEGIEPLMIDRGERLINLGLACYGSDKTVFSALYAHGLGAPTDDVDAQYRRGLLLGCLSNVTIQKAHWVFDFPRDLIGAEETRRILVEGEYALAETLVRNPAVSDKLLEQLYKREGPFAEVSDERLSTLVSSSRQNLRINTNEDDDESPDLGHYRIHDAILQLVETAPVNHRWMWALYDFLNNLSPLHAARTERLPQILQRWKSLDKNPSGEKSEGLFVGSLSTVDEFRCIIASLYGAGLKEDGLRAASKSNDIAMRAAFYGNGSLTVKDMHAAFERDGGAFVLAAIRNSSIIAGREQRKVFEEEMLGRDLSVLYRNFVNHLRKQYSYIKSYDTAP